MANAVLGSGATGVGRNCDFLADALAVINSETVVKCVLDGPPDMAPTWLQQSLPEGQCTNSVSVRMYLSTHKKHTYYKLYLYLTPFFGHITQTLSRIIILGSHMYKLDVATLSHIIGQASMDGLCQAFASC